MNEYLFSQSFGILCIPRKLESRSLRYQHEEERVVLKLTILHKGKTGQELGVKTWKQDLKRPWRSIAYWLAP